MAIYPLWEYTHIYTHVVAALPPVLFFPRFRNAPRPQLKLFAWYHACSGISLPTRAVCVSVSHIMYHMRTCWTNGTMPSGTEIMARMMQASSQQRIYIYETPKEGRVSHASHINYLRVACVYHSLYTVWHCAPVRFKVYCIYIYTLATYTYLILIPTHPFSFRHYITCAKWGDWLYYSVVRATAVEEKEKTMRKSDKYIERM